MSQQDITATIGADATPFERGMKDAQKALESASGAMTGGLSGLSSAVSSINPAFAAATAAVLGFGAATAKGISEFKDQTSAATSLANQLGITAAEGNVLATALGNVFIDKDTYVGAVAKITKALNTNEGAFKQLGVATRDSSGQLRPMQDIISETVGSLQQFKSGTDRNVMAQQLFGKSFQEILPLAKLNAAAMKDAAEEVDAYHKTADPAAIRRYKEAMENVGDAFEGVSLAVGRGAMPILSSVGEWFQQVGPKATEATIIAMDMVTDVWDAVTAAASALWDSISGYFTKISEFWGDVFGTKMPGVGDIILGVFKAIRTAVLVLAGAFEGTFSTIATLIDYGAEKVMFFAKIAKAAFSLDWDGVKAVWQQGTTSITDTLEKAAQKSLQIAEKYGEKIKGAWTGGFDRGSGSDENAPKGGSKSAFEIEGKKTKSAGSDTRFQEWKSSLELMKEAEGAFFKDSVAGDLEYWQQKLALVKGKGKEDVKLREQLGHEIFQLEKQLAQQNRQIQEQAIAEQKRISESDVNTERERIRALYEMGKISELDKLKSERTLQEQEFESARDALEQKMKLYEQDGAAYQRLQYEKNALEEGYALKSFKLNNDISIQRKKDIEGWLSPISSAMEKSVTGMVQGTLTLQKATSNIFNSMFGEFISLITKRTVAWAAGELANTQVSQAYAAFRKMLGIEEATQTVTTKSVEADAVVGANAAEAASGAAAAVAPTPFIGPALAIAAFGATLAMVLGAKGSIKSAAGGFDIPRGVNPMTQLHEEEMVLPKQYANAIRGMAENGTTPSSGGETHNHYHVQAWDSRDVSRFLSDHKRAVAGAVKSAQRDGFK